MTLTAAPRTSPYRVDELRRALHALDAGRFRTPAAASRARTSTAWRHPETALPVVGCVGSAGATTLALAMATASGGAARVIECAAPGSSGLVAASTAELGSAGTGWRRGTRGEVVLDRLDDPFISATDEIPVPPDRENSTSPGGVTVVDISWPLAQVLHTDDWMADLLRTAPAVVLVTTATLAGLRRLEVAVELLGTSAAARAVIAIRGPRRRKWDKALEHTLGPLSCRLADDGRLVEISQDRHLAVLGLGPADLPATLLAAAATVLTLSTPAPTAHDSKGTTR
jgi:hypothetical protein